MASAAGLMAREKKIARIAMSAASPLNSPEMIQALAEGLTLAEFESGLYKTSGYDPFELRELAIVVGEGLGKAAEHVAEARPGHR